MWIMWISVWITFNNNSNDYYYCFRTFQGLGFVPICIIIQIIIQLYPTCKNVQYPSYTKKHTIILYYYSTITVYLQRGLIYIIFHWGFCPKVGMCSTHTPTSKLYQIFTQFTKSHQIHFDNHFDKILKIQAKINFLII